MKRYKCQNCGREKTKRTNPSVEPQFDCIICGERDWTTVEQEDNSVEGVA